MSVDSQLAVVMKGFAAQTRRLAGQEDRERSFNRIGPPPGGRCGGSRMMSQ